MTFEAEKMIEVASFEKEQLMEEATYEQPTINHQQVTALSQEIEDLKQRLSNEQSARNSDKLKVDDMVNQIHS